MESKKTMDIFIVMATGSSGHKVIVKCFAVKKAAEDFVHAITWRDTDERGYEYKSASEKFGMSITIETWEVEL